MAYKVNLDFVTGMVTINGNKTPMGEFVPKNEIEQEIKMVIDRFYTPVDTNQLVIEYDDITELVHSDMLSSDDHSQCFLE